MPRLTRLVAYVGFIALMAMIGVTCIDIVLRLISRAPGGIGRLVPPAVPGVVDYVELTLIAVAHLGIAVTFLRGTHVGIDLIGQMLPVGLRRTVLRIGWAVCFLFMGACFVLAIDRIRDQFYSGIVSATVSLPVWWYWIPVILGTGLSAFACLVHVCRPLIAPSEVAAKSGAE